MQEVLSLVMSGGRGTPLYPLTKHRSRGSVPIAGKYRLIDVPLSNCLNSGLNRIYVLTQFLSVSLHRHITSTYKFDPFGRGFVEVLAAQVTNEAADWYRGIADAIRQHLRYVQEDGARDVLVLADDQLYHFDFRRLLQFHREQRADVTLAVSPVHRSQAPGLGILKLDEGGRVTAFAEKPQSGEQLDQLRAPAGWVERQGLPPGRDYLGSMGIYLFRREALFEMLQAHPQANDFAGEIFPGCLRSHQVRAYLFRGSWEHLESIRAYHEASLALAGDHPPFEFHSPEGVIFTRMRDLPASRVSAAALEHTLISDGCIVSSGVRMQRCVVGVRSRIGRNVTLREAVLLGANCYESDPEGIADRKPGVPPLGVGDDSVLERVIVDKNCRIGRGVRIANRRNLQEGEGENYVIRDGIVVLPNGAVVPDGTII